MGLHPSSNERVANRRRLLWRSGSSRRGNQGDQREVMKFTEKVRKEIVARANGRCESCGSIAMYNQIHHRRPRGTPTSTVKKRKTNKFYPSVINK